VWHEREIATMKGAFATANGGADIETTVYEGNATWGGYESDLTNPSPLYYKSVSLGAAVSLVDLYAAANRAGVTVNNHFHYGGNVWGATGPYPEVIRKPDFYALELLDTALHGNLMTCTVSGAGTWDDALTGENGVPYVSCYPYGEPGNIDLLIVNRHRTLPQQVEIPGPYAALERISLTGSDINANNESGETVTLSTTVLPGTLEDPVTETVPPFTAVVLHLSDTPGTGGSGGSGGAAGSGGSGGTGAGGGGSGAAGNTGSGGGNGDVVPVGGCSCASDGADGGALLLLGVLVLLFRVRRRRRVD